MLGVGFSGREVGGGEAGIEAAGGEPEHGGGDDEDAYGGHNASYLTHPGRIGKGLELPVSQYLRKHSSKSLVDTQLKA